MAAGPLGAVVKVSSGPRRVSNEPNEPSLLRSTSEIGRVVIGEELGDVAVLVHGRAFQGGVAPT